ncbi:multidrug transporter [Lojkania enalia]|uniref:Multidrug transporter n=1 Tax=Lojkania enalia TaxID=147567 RepID=A0A9P4JZC2_9PLEO|nr:multidrug transporter [Didymosphaeria enalia]
MPEIQDEIVDWDGPGDPQNPFNWPKPKKWRVTLLACFMTFVVQINGTMMTSAAEQINRSFHVSDEHFPCSYWPVLSWSLGGASAPMLALPLMESFGVKWSYLFIYACLIVFIIPQALAKNFATLIITRIITGGCSGVLANITSGIVSDIWKESRSKSFGTSLYIWGLLAGLNVGPVIGSIVLVYASWRWIFYGQIVFYTTLTPLLLLTLPEVRPDVLLTHRAKSLRKQASKPIFSRAEKSHTSLRAVLTTTILRPAKMLATEPVVFFFGLWSAFCIGTAFMFTQSIVQVYASLYAWTYFGTGIIQIATVIGEVLGLLASFYQDSLYFASASRNKECPGKPVPEARLYLSIPGSFFGLAAGLFWYAWTSYSYLHWILPTIGLALVGFGMFTVTAAVTAYILDCYSKYAASAIAGVAFLENCFAAFLPLATQSMYSNLGFQGAGSLLGGAAIVLSFIPLVLQRWGKGVRERSLFIGEAGHEV